MANTTFAQGNIESNARKAASDAGCLDDYNGSINFQVSQVGTCSYDCGPTCTAIGILQEVDLVPNPNNHIGPYVKLSPIAKVTFCGNDQVISVICY